MLKFWIILKTLLSNKLKRLALDQHCLNSTPQVISFYTKVKKIFINLSLIYVARIMLLNYVQLRRPNKIILKLMLTEIQLSQSTILSRRYKNCWGIFGRFLIARQGRTFPYIMSVQVSIVEETFTLKIVLVKDVSTIPFCENYRQVFRLSK